MEVVVSAPGKVLITGAYLVLERPNAGLVLSTSARFYAIVKPIHSDVAPDSWSWSWADVKVLSPQMFTETTYKLSLRDSHLRKVAGDGSSAFVEQAVQLAVAAAKAQLQHATSDAQDLLRKLVLQGNNNNLQSSASNNLILPEQVTHEAQD
jgi:phosphomevalonate kinase